MTIPHQFSSLLAGSAQTIVIAGTGLSAGIAPTIADLKLELDAVGMRYTPPVVESDFYVLAEVIIHRLESEGRSLDESKLSLAEAIGLFRDRSWFGETGVPLRGNTPRHRVIARFAVEKRLRAIVSLNWDALLEAGLDAVGLSEKYSFPRPWEISSYQIVVRDDDLPLLASSNVLPVIKPHGCVRDLQRARSTVTSGNSCPPITFKITSLELDVLAAGQTRVDKKVEGYVSECPLLAIGWKASERYLRNTITAAVAATNPTGSSLFTLISRSWYQEHDEIAHAYNLTQGDAFLQAGGTAAPSLDCVFQWLQSLYALRLIAGSVEGPIKRSIENLSGKIAARCGEHPLLNWADTWLPCWVRLCWRAGFVQAVNPATNERFAPANIPVTPRDVHIPIGTIAIQRRDLQAAAQLLAAIEENWQSFDFDKFPGALWVDKDQTLYLPVPAFRGRMKASALSALKPMIDTWTWPIKAIRLIWLDVRKTAPTAKDKSQMEAQIRMLLPLTAHTASRPLTWAPLTELKGV